MASSMGWIGGVINLLFGLGSSYENSKMSKAWLKSAAANSGMVMGLGKKMLDNADEDWEHFKSTFQPSEEAAATYAARDADIAGAEGKVSGAVASGMSQGGNAVLRRRVNPNSGSTSARLNDIAVAGGRAGGFGMGRARRGEEDRLFRERAVISAGARKILPESALTTGRNIDTLQTTIKHAAGVGDAYGQRAADSLYQAGQGAGQIVYGMGRGGYDSANQDWSNSSMKDGKVYPKANYVENVEQYMLADGGMVRGPGTGRSDSVPAMIDGEQPARVSNGEIVVPGHIVQKIGKRVLDELIAKYHRPTGRVIDGKATRVE